MLGRRCYQERRRQAGAHERDQIGALLAGAEFAESGVERHDQQEREQHLDTRQGHAQLAEELLQVAIGPLLLGLLAPG